MSRLIIICIIFKARETFITQLIVSHKPLKIEPNHSNALHNLGLVKYDLNRIQASIDYLRKAIHIDNSIAPFHYALGISLLKVGRLKEAWEKLRGSLEY